MMKLRSGYTLVELMAVVVIVSILAAIALPTVKNILVERKTSVAAIEVKGFLEAARARAVARGRSVTVILERLGARAALDPTTGVPVPTLANPSPSTPVDNFDVYNTCVRLTMAESGTPIEFETTLTTESDDPSMTTIPGAYSIASRKIFFDGPSNDGKDLFDASSNPVAEERKIIRISNGDPRLHDLLVAGSEILIPKGDSQLLRFTIKAPLTSAEHKNVPLAVNLAIAIANEGTAQYPWGSLGDIKDSADDQRSITAFQDFPSTVTRFYCVGRPRPIATTAQEMPRGTCIDLSLSGLSANDPNLNPPPSPLPVPPAVYYFRDCRREFASDWILPPTGTPAAVPVPSDLRPIYLTFSPNGTLDNILCNGPSSPNLRRIEPHSDLFLFVGRNDQVMPAVSSADIAAAEDASLKPNLTDPTGYWVRISPSSGAISATPAQAEHIIEDIAEYRSDPTDPAKNEPIGHLLEDSRSLAFTSDGTSQ